VHLACLVFQHRTVEDYFFLVARENFAAGAIKSGIFVVTAGIAEQTRLSQGQDQPADPGPIDLLVQNGGLQKQDIAKVRAEVNQRVGALR
jgi:hypothetical protein